MAYKGQCTIFCLRFGKKHHAFGFYFSSTMKESREKVEKGNKTKNRGEISDRAKYTSDNFNLGNKGVILRMI